MQRCRALQIIVIILSVIFTILGVFTNVGPLWTLVSPLNDYTDRYYYTYLYSNTTAGKITMYWTSVQYPSVIKNKFVGGAALCALGSISGALATVLAGLQLAQICTRPLNVLVPMLFCVTFIFFLVALALASVLWTTSVPSAGWVAGKNQTWAGVVPSKLGAGYLLTIVSMIGFFIVFLLSVVFSVCYNKEEYIDMDEDADDDGAYDSRSAYSGRSGRSMKTEDESMYYDDDGRSEM